MSDHPKNLIQKLAAVMGSVKHVAKRGRNDFHKYDYATEADIADAVRDGLAAQGVMLIPSVLTMEVTKIPRKSGGEDRLATLRVKYTVTDGTDRLEFEVFGEGQDAGDKATYKAMTGATKYALLKLFLIPTGDDPEDDGDEKPKRGNTSNTDARAAVKAATNGRQDPIMAYKMSALNEATLLLGDDDHAKKWLREVREDPKGERAWTEKDVEKIKTALTLLRAELNADARN